MRKVLIVDDEPDIRKLFCWLLARQDYRVETAEDGIAGLAAIGWFKPDLVLLNIMMPRMDGLTMLRALATGRRLAKAPRVIMASACSDTRTFELALSLGAVGFLNYPFDPKYAERLVQEAFDPTLDDAQRVVRAKVRHFVGITRTLGCVFAAREAGLLPVDRLSPDQRRELRESLLEAARKSLAHAPSQKRGSPSPGVDPVLTAMALAHAI